MKKLILLTAVLSLISCGDHDLNPFKTNNSSGKDSRRGYRIRSLSAYEIQKAFMNCSVESHHNRCTDFRSNRRLYRRQFYDHRCYDLYLACLDRHGVDYGLN